ncbi:hypothetical protein DFQ28_003639 [Apophysomyces sp. BC1034]|nr:hypothetical protein DFQ29_001348 [Apophysomyces sp. BC1021]KAG0193719.1 hypothetical protein DFQ28_003639 [Apophysomyces sp. BC1034]
MHTRIQDSVLVLIDSKRSVQREIMFTRLSGKDISKLTKLVKVLRTPLHGLGLSLLLKREYLNDNSNTNAISDIATVDSAIAFIECIKEMEPMCQKLAEATHTALTECAASLENFVGYPRTNLNSILWPFPRIFFSGRSTARDHRSVALSSQALRSMIDEFDARPTKGVCRILDVESDHTPRYGPLYLLFLYQYNLREHADQVGRLLEFIENIEQTRQQRRLWFPRMSLKKWFHSVEVDPDIGGDEGDYGERGVNHDLSLVRILTRPEMGNDQDGSFEPVNNQQGKMYHRDPDVDPPATFSQHVFHKLWRFRSWFLQPDTLFAFKTAVGVVLLAIPAFMAQNALWYSEWKGQWAMITLVLWNFPMAGMFNFSLIVRVAGTIVGGVLGIVAWEISRGNPYGLAVVLFVIILVCYHVFFYSRTYKVVALMTKVTMILVSFVDFSGAVVLKTEEQVAIYEYQYVVEGIPNYDRVWTVAGKRVLLVTIGLAASYVLSMIPYPVSGRVELRKRSANTICEIGRLYAILASKFLVSKQELDYPTRDQLKSFRKLALEIRRQITDERNLLMHTDYEPPLRGRFPKESYVNILDRIDNMADLVQGMGYVSRRIDSSWRRHISTTLTTDRQDYLTCIMTTLKLLSSTLAAKMSLPPYMEKPVKSRLRFAKLLEKKIQIGPAEISNPSFPAYSTYMMNSSAFVSELHTLLEVIEDLVGVEDPEEWLRIHT